MRQPVVAAVSCSLMYSVQSLSSVYIFYTWKLNSFHAMMLFELVLEK